MPQKQPHAIKPMIVICAYNEEANIGHALDEVIRAGLVPAKNVIVVNDGSTDKTSQIARGKGCTVIDFKKNLGKANAFFMGVRKALKSGATSVVALDADLVMLPKNNLQTLIVGAELATRNKKTQMFVSRVAELRSPLSSDFQSIYSGMSGTRSFSQQAAHSLYRFWSKHLDISLGYALETFLNRFFKKSEVRILMPKAKIIYGCAHRQGPIFLQDQTINRFDRWFSECGREKIKVSRRQKPRTLHT